jgi:hypothetical protein
VIIQLNFVVSAQSKFKSVADKQDSYKYFGIWFGNGSDYLHFSKITDFSKRVVMILTK